MFENYQESNKDLDYSFCENTRASQLILSSELKERGEKKQDRKVLKRGHCGLRRPVHSQKSIYKALFRGRVKTQARPPSRSSATGWNPRGVTSGKEAPCQCRRCKRRRFHPWVGKIPWRRAWQPTSVFLPGESHGQRSLAGYGPWGCTESDTTEVT